MESYDRAAVLRILRITPRQLSHWQRAGLVPVSDRYSFADLLQMKKVRDLRDNRVRAEVIRKSLLAMQKQVSGMENPLLEAGTFTSGSRIIFRHEGHAVDPIAGQFVMDFSPSDERVVSARLETPSPAESVTDYFARGVLLEDDPATQLEAMAAYTRALELDPEHAAAYINLGTLYYNRQDFRMAEWHYRKAVEVDPRYALAHFDLGNVLDETGRVEEAIRSYLAALDLHPAYADAHYNLALAYEKLRQFRRALRHWRAYLRLDRSGPWAAHAKNQVQRILQNERLQVVFRRGR